MSFLTESQKKDIEINVIAQIDGVYYSIKQVDSGLVIDADKMILKTPRLNGVNIDIRRVSTPIATFSFRLEENNEDPLLSSEIMQDTTQWLGKEVIIHAGFITGSFDWVDYKELARTRITTVTKIRNGYSIKTKEVTALIDVDALNLEDSLQTAMIPATTTLNIVDASVFPASGTITINGEFMSYASKSGNTLQSLTRGLYGSTAETHDLGSEVFLVTVVEDVNPIDLMLQVILSDQGTLSNDPTYDVLFGGLNISPSDVDITTFESIRDEFFSGELHDYYIYNNTSMLKFLERTALAATNTRLITIDGKISLALLDQVDFTGDLPILDESSIINTPTWSIDENKIVNRIEIKYDFNLATQTYESLAVFEDSESIANFGVKKPLKLNFEGVTTALNGASIVSDRAGRLLGRMSTARGKITVKSHFNASNLNIGGNLQLVHRFLPQQGGTLGFSDRLEIMSRSIDLIKAEVTTKLEFTSYTGVRIAFIAPSPRITAVTDQKTLTVDDASCLEVGYRISLFKDGPEVDSNPTAGSYLPDAVNEIQSIAGNIVTFVNDFVSVLGTDIVLKMSDYDVSTEQQRSKYAFVGENSGFFVSDNSKSYQIIF